MDETPETVSVQAEPADAGTAAPKKKAKAGLFIAIGAACVVALAAAAAIFLLSRFSPNARFDRAMQDRDYQTAEEIYQNEDLKASEVNDGHYLALADLYAAIFQRGTADYNTAMQNLIRLKGAAFFDPAVPGEIETREETVAEAQVERFYASYRSGQTDYETAAAQIGGSNPFQEAPVQKVVDRYLAKTDEQREVFYAEAVAAITDPEADPTPDGIIDLLAPFGDFRNAQALTGIYTEIRDGNGVGAAKLLLAYREAVEASADVIDAEAPSAGLFDAIKETILNRCFVSDSSDGYGEKLDLRLRSDYTKMLFGDDDGKITTLFGSESIKALNLGKTLDLDWFRVCGGGTGKILYLAHYLSDSSFEPYDSFYFYRYENLKDLPQSKMPEGLEEVEYLILYDEGGKFYANYYSNDGSKVVVYRRTIRVTVRQFPSGEVVYDSGLLTGPTPKSTFTVFSGTKFAYGDDPDLTAVLSSVKALVGLD